jgi:hypothetical protein
LRDQVPDLPLALGAQDVERPRRDFPLGDLVLSEQLADLRSIPMRDGEGLAVAHHLDEGGNGGAHVASGLGPVPRTAGPLEGVSAEGNDDSPHRRPGEPGSYMVSLRVDPPSPKSPHPDDPTFADERIITVGPLAPT